MIAKKTDNRRKMQIGVVVTAFQWLLLTSALGTMVVYTDRSFEGILGFHLDSGYAFVGAGFIGFLMGATIERSKALIPLALLSCVAASGIYVSLLFYPVWNGTLVQTIGLENFASTRALLYFGLTVVPVSFGAMLGRLLANTIPGGDLLRRSEGAERYEWWLNRKQTEDAQRETPREV
jgi:hypothetical protein